MECHKRNGAILKYYLHRLHGSDTICKAVIASGEANTEVFSNLCPFIKYQFRVAAVNVAGPGQNATLEGGLVFS